MANIKIIFFLVVGVLQVCTANPFSSEEGKEIDVTELFTAEEIERAKSAGLTESKLVRGKEMGWTLEEMIQLYKLSKETKLSEKDHNEICVVLVPGYKPSTYLTDARKLQFNTVLEAINYLPERDIGSFLRNTICHYLSRPDAVEREASTFGTELSTNYISIHFLKMKAKQSSTSERTKIAKEMCCVHEEPDKNFYLNQKALTALPDADMTEFGDHWNLFETENTSKSLVKVCEFLRTKQPLEGCIEIKPIKEDE